MKKQKELWKGAADDLTKIGYRKEMRAELKKLLSEEELQNLGVRWEIKRRAKMGQNKSQIAREIGVDRNTVRRWS